MAPGGRRLGTFLNDPLLEVLRVLDATAAPRGRERPAAKALRDWCASRWPDLDWDLDPYSDEGANLVVSCGPGPLLYSHLDTSLDCTPADAAITGRNDHPAPLRVAGSQVDGFGLGVARGPAAAAIVGFAAARRGTLLLAGSGTHRRGGSAVGLDHYLAEHPLPASAVIAKCGPPTVLWEEPGAAYLRARVTGIYGAALAPDSAVPAGGVIAHTGVLLDAFARWRARYLDEHRHSGQVGPQAAVGAIRSGSPGKPDLLPAHLELDLYVVTVPGADHRALGGQLAAYLTDAMRETDLAGCSVEVTVESIHEAGVTAADAPIVRAATQCWLDEFGSTPTPIAGWTGSTDGVVLRCRGVDTVRLGPQPARAQDDPRRDILDLDNLWAFSRIYAHLLNT